MKKISLILLVLMLVCVGCSRKSKEELQAEGIKLLNEGNPGGAVVLFKSALEKDENYSDARFQLAKAYAAMGKRDQAEREFTKVLKQNPSLDAVLLELSRLAIANQKGDEAFKLAKQYLEKHPGNAEALELLGVSCAVNKQYAEAESYLQQVLATEPGRTSAKLELASVHVAAGVPQKGQALLQAVIQADPQGKRAYYMLAGLESGLGNVDKAESLYRKLLEINKSETFAAYKLGLILLDRDELDKADAIADELVKNYPTKGDGHRLKGLVNFHRKNFAEAINSLLTSLKYAPSLEGYYFLGLCYYNRGELESALSQFRKILDNVPTSRQARIMTATVLLTQKRVDDAISEINRVLEQNSQDALAHNLLGNAYMAKGMYDEGMHELNRATKLDPKVVDAYLKKGYFYFSRGKNSEGEAELATAVQAAPDALSSRLLLASYYQRGGNSAKALSLLRAGLGGKKSDAPLYNSIAAILFSENKRDEGIKNLQKAKQIDPVFPASYQNLATFYAASGNYDKAIDEYAVLLRNDPKNVQAMLAIAGMYEVKGKDDDALAYYRKARDSGKPGAVLALAAYHVKQKETDKALKVLDQAIKSDGRNIAAMEMKGRILISEKEYKDALKVFDDIDTANPDAGVALKISTYMLMKEPSKALEQARRIIAKYPSSARGYLVLASIYENQKDYATALAEVKKGLRVDPLNVQALLTQGHLHELRKEQNLAMASYDEALRKKSDFAPALFAQGALLDTAGKKKEAIGKYREALEKAPSYVPALNNLAYLYAEGWGNKEEALRLVVTAFRQEPGNAGIMDTLGYVLHKNGRKDDAKKVLEQAIKLLPNNPTVMYHLALAYRQSGEASKSVQSLQKALAMGAFPEAAAARTMLAEVKR